MDEIHPLALILETARLARRYVEAGLAAKGLTFNQYNMLRFLASRDFAYPSEAAEELSLWRPTVTVILRNLEKKGWILRSPDPDSRRNVRICLSASGREKTDTVVDWIVRVKGSLDPFVGLKRSEIQQLGHHLLKVRDSIEEQLDGLVERMADTSEDSEASPSN